MVDRFRITQGWARRFEAENISIPELLWRSRLPADLFRQEKIFLTTSQLFEVWRNVAQMSSDPGFGLKLGMEMRFERSHPLAIACVCSRSFGDALQRLARYKRLTCPEEIRIHRKGQETSVQFLFVEASDVEPEIMVDVGLSWILNVGRRGSDSQIKPLRLDLLRSPRHRQLLEGHFGCPVQFKASRNALVFRSSDLDRPFVTHNEELVGMIGAQLEAELDSTNPSQETSERVKQTLRRSMAGRRPTLEGVAQELGLSTRTLQRRLSASKVGFQELLEAVRRELAHHFLSQVSVEYNEIAFLLGYGDPNSFFRAFQGWEGISPTEWRTRNRSEVFPRESAPSVRQKTGGRRISGRISERRVRD
jgi:AraC-like DNA-binding protein